MGYVVGILVFVTLLILDQAWYKGHYIGLVARALRNALAAIGL